MRTAIEKRLKALEQSAATHKNRITRIVLTASGTDYEVVIFDARQDTGRRTRAGVLLDERRC